MTERVAIVAVTRLGAGEARTDQDLVSVEDPLVIQLRRTGRSPETRSLGVLMRTPGDDEDLVLGLLHAEGIIRTRTDVIAVRRTEALGDEGAPPTTPDVLEIDLAEWVDLDHVVGRALPSTSACGLCGRLAIQAVTAAGDALAIDGPAFSAALICSLPDALRARQTVFAETGGLHAAGLFAVDGRCLAIREDVGRHNAVDKVIGWALGAGHLPARETVLAVSGRVAFEIVQKAVFAGIPALAAVGAPSSLAVDAARAARMTLCGFVRDGRFNVYAGRERLR